MARASIFFEFTEKLEDGPYGNVRVDTQDRKLAVTGHIFPTDWLLVAEVIAMLKETRYRDRFAAAKQTENK